MEFERAGGISLGGRQPNREQAVQRIPEVVGFTNPLFGHVTFWLILKEGDAVPLGNSASKRSGDQ
jgi:hypothetical protein